MNKDRVKGKIDEVAGIAKREVGEWGGDIELQVEGIAQQVKGKVENAWGKAKDAVDEANAEAAVQHESRIDVAMECETEEAKHNKRNKRK
jgi:uncharacterized protein YjbJ (UPF0337 family)